MADEEDLPPEGQLQEWWDQVRSQVDPDPPIITPIAPATDPNTSIQHFRANLQKTALGNSYWFEGPGMSRWASVHLNVHSRTEASVLASMLEKAFNAGKEARSAELRKILGIPDRWGR